MKAEFTVRVDRASDGRFHVEVDEVTKPGRLIGRFTQRLLGSPWRTRRGNDLHGMQELAALLSDKVALGIYKAVGKKDRQ